MDFPLHSIVTLVTILSPLHVAAYINGKVEAACSDMVPQHGYPIQNTTAPYALNMSKTSYQPGEKITVTLTNTSASSRMEGFMIQARQQNSNTPVGSFLINSSDIQTLTCTTAASTVSHSSNNKKYTVEVTWVAPSSNIPNIQMRATVVRNGSIYWTNVVGPVLTYAGSGGSQMLIPVTNIGITIWISLLLSHQF